VNLSPFAFLKSCTISHIWEDNRMELITTFNEEGGLHLVIQSESGKREQSCNLNPVQVAILKEVLKEVKVN
jgi:hypothetical protein